MSERQPSREEPTSRESGGGGEAFLRDLLGSIGAVLGIGFLLFAISGVWPPMVAIESGSMEPNIDTGDLVFVMDEHRFAGPNAVGDTGVVPAAQAQEYTKFNQPGDVIIYEPSGDAEETPVIHRAVFWVNESENWYDKADDAYIPDDRESCAQIKYCEAPHSGFITLGDNNGQYDQIQHTGATTPPVKPEWVIGTAEFRLPIIGQLRLGVGSLSAIPTVEATELAS